MSIDQSAPLEIDKTQVLGGSYNATEYLDLGHRLSQRGQLAEAEASFRNAIELDPDLALAYNNLGWVRQVQGNNNDAVANYLTALDLNESLQIARRNLAPLLVQMGRRAESIPTWHAELNSGFDGVAWMIGLITSAMENWDLNLAGEYAAILAELRWATPWYPLYQRESAMPLPVQTPEVFLTIPKLKHDIEQFEYLQRNGVLGDEFTPIIDTYQQVIKRLSPRGIDARAPLDPDDQLTIGHVYNRIVHVRQTPRVRRVFSGKWDPEQIERQYLDKPLGMIVLDDFLSDEALENVRLFALESTVWTGNRYANGRFGAFFNDGFNCPLLIQIAEELRNALPNIILDRYPLRQLWGFKNGERLPADSTVHADFAAVNVNFWITPEDANLDPDSGGLVIYDVDAPLSWDFETYNGRPEVIKAFLEQQQARRVYIPYRQNRAIIFDSDLFHASAGLHFRPGYENRRINITMLYGDRENDVHNLDSAKQTVTKAIDMPSAWRSAAFSRTRRFRSSA